MNNLRKCLYSFVFLFFSVTTIAQDFTITEAKAFTDYPAYVRLAKFSPYGNYFAITVGDNTVELYDKNFRKIWSNQSNAQNLGGQIAFSPDEKYMAFSKYKSKSDIGVLRLSDLQVIQTLDEHQDYVNKIIYSPDGKNLITTSDDYSVRCWNWDGIKFENHNTLVTYTCQANTCAMSADGLTLVTAFQDGTVKIFQNKNGKYSESQSIVGNKYSVESMDFHPSGKYFAFSGSDFNVHVFQKEGSSYKFLKEVKQEYGTVYGLSFSPDGKYIAIGRSNSTVKIWSFNNAEFKEEKELGRHYDNIFGVEFSEDGKYLATTSSDKSCIVWALGGVKPNAKVAMQQMLGVPFTSAQRTVLTGTAVDKIYAKIDKSISGPKDEFETNQDYQKRLEKLKSHVLLQLQKETETAYGVTSNSDKTQVNIKPEKLGSYDADNEEYTFYFLQTTAKVKLPVAEAKAFKESWQKAKITAHKTLSKDGVSFAYSDFMLVPSSGKSYVLSIKENPFTYGPAGFTSSKAEPVRIGDNDIEDPALYDENNIKGVNYALVIGTNDYTEYTDLTNPLNDGKTIAKELKDNYSFETEVVENPTLDQIMGSLRSYATKKYNPNDQLFIFIAGHGKYDEVFKEGYLVAKESKLNDEGKTTLLSHSNLRTVINNIPCKHIYLAMDVCFGGTFDPMIATRGTDVYTNVTKADFIERKLAHKTRLYLTSGGKEYVPDGRPGEHSPFARKFLEALRSYGGEDGILTTGEIFTYVEKVVPQPRTGEFGENEPGSDFIFVAK